MKIAAKYSHLNGLEYLLIHKQTSWNEIKDVIANVDAQSCRTKISQEQRTKGRALYSPIDMNKSLKQKFQINGWTERRHSSWVTHDEKVIRRIITLPPEEQKQKILNAGYQPIETYNQTDFVKERVAVEVQFGK